MNAASECAKDNRKKYSNYQPEFEHLQYLVKVYDLLKKLDKTHKFKKMLDIGCSSGIFAQKIKNDFGLDAYGTDISPDMILVAKSKGIKAKVCNLEKKLTYKNDSFDLVTCCAVIEHIYNTNNLLQEIHRILKKDGILVVSTDNLASLVNRVRILFGLYPEIVPEWKEGLSGHIRAYTLPVLKKQIVENKFLPVLLTSPNITFPITNPKIPFFLKKNVIRLGAVFPKIGSIIIVVARKP